MPHAKVILFKTPGAFDGQLTYLVPSELEDAVVPGAMVNVPLRQRLVRAVVVGLSDEADAAGYKLREIADIVAGMSLPSAQLSLAEYISGYYRTSLTRALRLMLSSNVWKGAFSPQRARSKKAKTPTELYPKPDYSMFPLSQPSHQLTDEQQGAVEGILSSDRPVLLRGVTGSGKTEVYLRVILDAVKKGRQAIFLVPEISLTPQMIDTFRAYFGDHIALFHSRLTEAQRALEWYKAYSGYAPLSIGSRSAVFSPTSPFAEGLGAIVVDEEHEWTYKQESAPYYQAHEVAVELARLSGKECRLIFGSATPRLETLHRARGGEFREIRLERRVHGGEMPKVKIVDLREEFRERHFHIFSRALQRGMTEALGRGSQIILFVNQRGSARAVVCRDCGHTEKCPNCEVSLTYHKAQARAPEGLVCHYCDRRQPPPLVCPECGSAHIRHMGVGTQKVEDEVKALFPKARVLRADRDTTGTGEGFMPIYNTFKKGEADILIGTQMIAKGLDFEGVSLIGLVLADVGLNVPDFRSHERLFQLITQVAGRCGRGQGEAHVVLQTYQPEHFAIKKAAAYQYEEFMEREASFRERLSYPPYSRIIKLTALGPDEKALHARMETERDALEAAAKDLGLKVSLSCAPAMVPRISGNYYYHLLIRSGQPEKLLERWSPPEGWRLDIDPVHTA